MQSQEKSKIKNVKDDTDSFAKELQKYKQDVLLKRITIAYMEGLKTGMQLSNVNEVI